jgi:hypothetical protein
MIHLKLLKKLCNLNVTPPRSIPRATRISLFERTAARWEQQKDRRMGILISVARAAGTAATIASLSGCGYVSPPLPVAPTLPAALSDRGLSWMSPDAVRVKSLLYVSDSRSYDVYVYSFPDLKLKGKLTGFDRPEGECSDARGDVWITDTQTKEIVRYRHGGRTIEATLRDPLGYPVGCAIDPKTGDLAVTDLFTFSGSGDVLIYKKATGTPRPYTNPAQYYYYFASYDDKGDLYASGMSQTDTYRLSVLAPRGRSMVSLPIKGPRIFVPGTVQWIGSSLLLGDQRCRRAKTSCLYEAAVLSKSARITRRVPLTGSCDVAQVAFSKGRFAGGDDWRCGPGHSSTDVWPYPRGGAPVRARSDIQAPVGATISNVR